MLITEETLYSVADEFFWNNKTSRAGRDILVIYGYSTNDKYCTIVSFAYWNGDIDTEKDIKKTYNNLVKKWNYAYFDCNIINDMPVLVSKGKKKKKEV